MERVMTARYDLESVNAMLWLLSERWPKCFFVFEQRRRPLALRIDQAITAAMADTITPEELEAALRHYCGNTAYLFACREGADRIGLDGEPAGTVTAHEAEHAVYILERRRQKAAAKAKANKLTTAQQAKLAPRPEPKRISLSDLRAAAQQRRAAAS